MWLPTSNYINNQCLMETAVDDKLLKREGKFEVINNCRMYLGVFFISELLKDESKIDKDYLNGNKRSTKDVNQFQGIQ